jgi:hypothetical protein
MELVIPLVVIGLIVLIGIGFRLARRDTGRGPHPDDQSGGAW